MAGEMSALGRELFEIFRPEPRMNAPLIEPDNGWLDEPITQAEIAAAHAAIEESGNEMVTKEETNHVQRMLLDSLEQADPVSPDEIDQAPAKVVSITQPKGMELLDWRARQQHYEAMAREMVEYAQEITRLEAEGRLAEMTALTLKNPESIDQLCEIRRTMQQYAAAFQKRGHDFLQKAQKLAAGVSSLEGTVKLQMEAVRFKRMHGKENTLRVVKNPASVEIEDLGLIPSEYLDYGEPKPDKAKIKQALTEGKDVPGARLVNDRTRLEFD